MRKPKSDSRSRITRRTRPQQSRNKLDLYSDANYNHEKIGQLVFFCVSIFVFDLLIFPTSFFKISFSIGNAQVLLALLDKFQSETPHAQRGFLSPPIRAETSRRLQLFLKQTNKQHTYTNTQLLYICTYVVVFSLTMLLTHSQASRYHTHTHTHIHKCKQKGHICVSFLFYFVVVLFVSLVVYLEAHS